MSLAALAQGVFKLLEPAPGLPLVRTELAPCNELGGERHIACAWEGHPVSHNSAVLLGRIPQHGNVDIGRVARRTAVGFEFRACLGFSLARVLELLLLIQGRRHITRIVSVSVQAKYRPIQRWGKTLTVMQPRDAQRREGSLRAIGPLLSQPLAATLA